MHPSGLRNPNAAEASEIFGMGENSRIVGESSITNSIDEHLRLPINLDLRGMRLDALPNLWLRIRLSGHRVLRSD